MNERVASLAAASGAAIVIALLAVRSILVPPFAFVERQWDAASVEGPPLREMPTRWARLVSVFDATLARPGGVLVEWRGFLPIERAGQLGVVFESGGPASIAIDGTVLAQTGRDGRARGIAEVSAGSREVVARVAVPEDRGSFRAVLRMPDGRSVPLEEADVTVESPSVEFMAAARAHRRWADPLLAIAATFTAFALAASLRGGSRSARLGAELVATALVFAVALLVPHGAGFDRWGTWPFGSLAPLPRAALLLAGLVPWWIVRTGRTLRMPSRTAWRWIAPVVAFAIFWLLREQRVWGDGWITLAILEGRANLDAFGPFFWKEPLDRLIAVFATNTARAFGGDAATAIALTSCVAGAAAVAALVRFSDDRDDSGATAALVLTAGAALVFFGHVENYSWVSAAILVFLLATTRVMRSAMSPFVAGALGGLAVAFHPVAGFVVLPALVATSWANRGSAVALWGGAAIPPVALVLACAAFGIAWPAVGPNRFADDPSVLLSVSAAFAPDHLATVANRCMLLLSPGIALAALSGIGRRPSRGSWPLVAASLGSLVCFVFLHGKIRPEVQDWDLYAPAAFPVAMLAARALRGPEAASTRAWCAGVSGAVLLLGVLGNR